jgi:ribokinase
VGDVTGLADNPLDVLVVGSLHLDIMVGATHLPAIDETVHGSGWKMVCGGKGGNQACWAARLGANTAMISRVGKDDFGTRLLGNLRSSGVDVGAVTADESAGSGMSVAILDANGDYGAVIVSGANLAIPVDEALAAIDRFGAPKVVVLQNEVDEALNEAVAEKAKKTGAIVIVNAAPARQLAKHFAENIDVLIVNRVEAAMMSDLEVTNQRDAIMAVPALRRFGRTVIVTLGGDGLVVAEEGLEPVVIDPVKIKVASTHGAGDCFVAQLSAALAKGYQLKDAAMLANATAAAYVSGQLTFETTGSRVKS